MEKYTKGPIAIRFPKASEAADNLSYSKVNELIEGKLRVLEEGRDITIISIGSMLGIAKKTREILEKSNISTAIVDLFCILLHKKHGINQILCTRWCNDTHMRQTT